MTTYSFSLDRAVWNGEYATRQAAIDAGLAHAKEVQTPPETFYVGQKITPNDRAYGHAQDIIRTMRRRVLEDNGDIADQFLRKPSDKQIADLDNAIEATVRAWMDRQNLAPNWTRIEAVSEYPVQSLSSFMR